MRELLCIVDVRGSLCTALQLLAWHELCRSRVTPVTWELGVTGVRLLGVDVGKGLLLLLLKGPVGLEIVVVSALLLVVR